MSKPPGLTMKLFAKIWALIQKYILKPTKKEETTTPVDDIPWDSIQHFVGVAGSVMSYALVDTDFGNVTLENPKNPRICWHLTQPVQWEADPSGLTYGLLWVVLDINGLRYAAPIEWLATQLPRDRCTVMENQPGQPPFIQSKGAPVSSFYPTPGVVIGLFCTSIPDPMSGPEKRAHERTRIISLIWPK